MNTLLVLLSLTSVPQVKDTVYDAAQVQAPTQLAYEPKPEDVEVIVKLLEMEVAGDE